MGARPPLLLPTFRDPAGQLRLHDDFAERLVRPPFDMALEHFLGTEQAHRLVEDGRLIASEVCGTAPLIVRHPRVPFISYPWEWPAAMWMAAARLTLDLCLDLLQEGRILRDATPLNVLFWGARPMLVDVLSVEPADPARRTWPAYGQFVRTFGLPLLARRELGWPLAATMSRRDGYEPEELWPHLSLTQRLDRGALRAVTLPTLLGRRKGGEAAAGAENSMRVSDPELARYSVERAIRGLEAMLDRLAPAMRKTQWSAYAGSCAHYADADHAAKREFVREVVMSVRPERVLDIGCNTGEYSQLAAENGAGYVVGMDGDEEALNAMCLRLASSEHSRAVTAVLADLARPTPAIGWLNRESLSLLERCRESFDLVLLLAVVHHLLLREQIPLGAIAELCASLTRRDLLIEWVPASDPMFRSLMRGREAMYGGLNETAFLEEFGRWFAVRGSRQLGNGRTLFHLRHLSK